MEITIDRLKLLNLQGFKKQERDSNKWFSSTTTFYFSCGAYPYELHFSQYPDVTYASIDYFQGRHYMKRVTFSDMIAFTEYLIKTIKYGKKKTQTNIIRKLMLTEFIEDPTL